MTSQPRTANGCLLGRPRGDGRVLAVLNADTWQTWHTVADRLGLQRNATLQALWRAQQRGLIEHRRGIGYRIARPAS